MSQNDWPFSQFSTETHCIIPSPYLKKNEYYEYGKNSEGKTVIIVSTRNYEEFMNSLQYKYEDVEMELV